MREEGSAALGPEDTQYSEDEDWAEQEDAGAAPLAEIAQQARERLHVSETSSELSESDDDHDEGTNGGGSAEEREGKGPQEETDEDERDEKLKLGMGMVRAGKATLASVLGRSEGKFHKTVAKAVNLKRNDEKEELSNRKAEIEWLARELEASIKETERFRKEAATNLEVAQVRVPLCTAGRRAPDRNARGDATLDFGSRPCRVSGKSWTVSCPRHRWMRKI